MSEHDKDPSGDPPRNRSFHRGFEFFASPPDAPRVRRSSDTAVAVAGAALVAIFAVVRGDGTSVDEAWSAVVEVLPTWLTWSGRAAYVVSIATAAALLAGIALLARHRLELLRDLVLAAALAIVAAGALTRFVDDGWPAVALTNLDQTRTTFPAFLVTAMIAVQAAAAPHLAAPVRRIGWIIALAGAVGGVMGGVSQVVDTVGAVLVGLVAAAAIRLAFGTSAGTPSLARVRAGLGDLGISLVDLEYLEHQPPSSTILDGVTRDGVPVYIRVLDRDSWKNSLWSRAWQAAWYQDTGTQQGSSRRQQIEHEALAGVLAGRAGVEVFDLVAVGEATNDDAIVVLARAPTRLADLHPDAVDDELLGRIWHQVVELHAAGLSYGLLDTSRIWIDSNGQPVLGDFSRSRIAASDESMELDIVELLVSLTLMVGPDRAIASARSALGDATLVHALPLLQSAALSPETKRGAHRAKLRIDKLRTQTATALGVQPPKVEELQRVSLGHVALLAATIFAVYGLISQLADIGFSTIVDALSNATWGLVIVALILVQLTNFTDALSLAATSPKPVPIGITTVEQFAIGFVNVAVPSSAGRIAVNVRYFQRLGISAVTSSTSATLVSVLGLVSQVLLLVLTIVVGKQSIDLSNLQTGGGVPSLLVFALAVVVVGVVLVGVVPSWRHRVESKLRAPMRQIKTALEVLKDPKRLLTAIGGQIGTEVLYASGLMLCVLALGGSVNVGQALFINITVALFAGIMPVPGGIGVSEAGLTAGLAAVGVSSDIALPAVIVYRLCSYYLPPLWGWVSLQWLTHHDYL